MYAPRHNPKGDSVSWNDKSKIDLGTEVLENDDGAALDVKVSQPLARLQHGRLLLSRCQGQRIPLPGGVQSLLLGMQRPLQLLYGRL